jgi:hypothetical protein
MPYFSVSWFRAISRLCPKWLQDLVNEEESEVPGLDVQMSMRAIEDLPLPPLPPELQAVEEEGIKDLSPEEISELEALFDASNVSEACEWIEVESSHD